MSFISDVQICTKSIEKLNHIPSEFSHLSFVYITDNEWLWVAEAAWEGDVWEGYSG